MMTCLRNPQKKEVEMVSPGYYNNVKSENITLKVHFCKLSSIIKLVDFLVVIIMCVQN